MQRESAVDAQSAKGLAVWHLKRVLLFCSAWSGLAQLQRERAHRFVFADAVRWIHTNAPWTSPLEGVPQKGRALRAAAHSFSVQASAAHLHHLRAPGAE